MLDFRYPEIGKKRLGRLIAASIKMQKMSYRDVEELTSRLYYKSLNKGTIGSYLNGHLDNYQQYTLQKFSFLLFEVDYFLVSDEDPIGSIVFKNGCRASFDKTGKLIKNSISVLGDQHLEALAAANDVKELPLLSERYQDFRQLEAILNCESLTKSVQSNNGRKKVSEAVS